ncbi:unnamed protein product [Lupinus luteus]|uniref:BHLH domain-containing protein n=1 Tax=Lupinus luteus TaxID=3873 RepID=A0AAV1WK51_LUPLU
MAEEFLQAGTFGESWWNMNSSRSVFPLMTSSLTCSVAANDAGNYNTWLTDFLDLKPTRSCAEDTNNNYFASDASLGFLEAHKPQQSESAASESGSIFIDMGFGLSSSTSLNWNQSLFAHCSGKPENNFVYVLQEETGLDSSNDLQSQKDWCPNKSQSLVDAFKSMNQELCLDQHGLNSITSTGLSCGFPIGSTTSYAYPSNLVQSLYDPSTMSYSSPPNYGTSSSNTLSPTTWSEVPNSLMPKQHLSGELHFSNNTPFCNASAEALNDIRAGVFSSSKAQYQTPTFEEKPISPSTQLSKLKKDESPDTISVGKKSGCEPAFKRQRIETPSPLPTFKVRKEKLGDRITALQQLVSPFGKTDTASVLHEAIDYIKFLHDQVTVLNTSYLKKGAPIQHQQRCDNLNDSEGPKQDLRSRGLCLVPISSTFPVVNETSVDFWTLTFGGAFISS